MALTFEQQALLRAEIDGDPTLAAYPITPDGSWALADTLNLDAVPAFVVWLSQLSTAEVKLAINWALRQIGKRNRKLNKVAIRTAEEIKKIDSKAARWIAADALRELQSDAVIERLKR